jgi:Tfp pilus assembly protein PilX
MILKKIKNLILSSKSNDLVPLKYQRGVSLYLSIIMLSLIFAIALIISDLFLIRLQLSRDILNSTAAFYGADSALECAQMEITKQTVSNPAITCSASNPNLKNLIVNNCGSIVMSNGAEAKIISTDITCTTDGTDRVASIRSTGAFKGTKRSTKVDF